MQGLAAARVLLHGGWKDYRLASVTVLHIGLSTENRASDRTIAGREAQSPSSRPLYLSARNCPSVRLQQAERKRARSENLGCTTGPSGVFRGIKCVENSFFAAEIPAIEFAGGKHYPVPAAASLVHFEFRANHRISFISIGIGQCAGRYTPYTSL